MRHFLFLFDSLTSHKHSNRLLYFVLDRRQVHKKPWVLTFYRSFINVFRITFFLEIHEVTRTVDDVQYLSSLARL